MIDPAKFYRRLAELLIGFPADLEVDCSEMSHSYNLVARVHADDHGKILGSRGVTFNAFKVLLSAYSVRHKSDKTIHLTQLAPTRGSRQVLTPFKQDGNWEREQRSEKLRVVLQSVCDDVFASAVRVEANEQLGGNSTTFFVQPCGTCTLTEQEVFALIEALEQIFHAIGKAKGRIVFVKGIGFPMFAQ